MSSKKCARMSANSLEVRISFSFVSSLELRPRLSWFMKWRIAMRRSRITRRLWRLAARTQKSKSWSMR